LPFRATVVARCHVGRSPSLVDENQLLWSQFDWLATAFGARLGNTLSQLFGCTRGLFFSSQADFLKESGHGSWASLDVTFGEARADLPDGQPRRRCDPAPHILLMRQQR